MYEDYSRHVTGCHMPEWQLKNLLMPGFTHDMPCREADCLRGSSFSDGGELGLQNQMLPWVWIGIVPVHQPVVGCNPR